MGERVAKPEDSVEVEIGTFAMLLTAEQAEKLARMLRGRKTLFSPSLYGAHLGYTLERVLRRRHGDGR